MSGRVRLIVAVLTLLVAILGALALGRFGMAQLRPNVLIVTIDTLRADRLGAYGYRAARTPVLDRLAREATLFEEAYSSAPITMPAHSTIMTGLLPPVHGVRDNGAYALPDEALTLAERLRAQGYLTQAFVSAVVLSKRYNLNQGFDLYDDKLWDEEDPKLFMIRERQARETIGATLQWLDEWQSRPERAPFFTWVHLFDPHQPHRAPAWIASTSGSGYDAEVTYADQQLGRLIEALRATGELDRTLILVTADHGESLGEHGEKTHAVFVYRSTMHVPLIVRYPGAFRAGQRVTTPAHHIDIFPTVLDVLNLPEDPELSGISLRQLASGQAGATRPLYSESLLSELGFGMAPLYAVRESGHSLIRAPRPELYDMVRDPGETQNLFGDPAHQATAESLDFSLQELLDSAADQALSAPRNPLSEESIQMLQSLGYLQGASERAAVSGMDPKDGIHIYNQLEDARKAAQQDDWAESERLARAILEQIPAHASARGVLATALLNQGRTDEAKDQYLHLVAQNPAEFRVLAMLGALSLRTGRLDEAERYYRDALAAAPTFVEAMSGLGLAAMLRGDEKAARDWFDQILRIDPDFPDVHRLLGDWHFERGEFAQARASYEQAMRMVSAEYRTLLQAAASARRSKDSQQARQWLEQATKLHPTRWVAYYNLSCLHALEGRPAEAHLALRKAIAIEPDVIRLARADSDWAALRADPEFQRMEAEAAAAARAERTD